MAITKAWRTAALEMVLNAKTADLPRGNIDGAHRTTLDTVLDAHGVDGVPPEDRDAMVDFWHRLDPWRAAG